MTLSSRSTLFLLATVAIVAIAIITWTVRSSWLSSLHLQALHTTLAVQANDLPDDAQLMLTRLNSLLLASVFQPDQDQELAEAFEAAAAELRERLETESATIEDERLSRLVSSISQQFESYVAAAHESMLAAREKVDPAERFKRIETAREQGESILLDLSRASEISDDELEETFRSYHSGYSRLALLLILLPGFCIALAGAAIFVALQNHVSSLRLDLSQAKLAQAKQEKLASLGTMASGVAHEIRNPLTAIKARLFVLDRKLGANDEARSQAGEIGNEINRLDRIVKEFLAFGRPPEPIFATVIARGLLEEVKNLLQRELEARGIALAVAPIDPAVKAWGDAEQIKQILINLTQNAADASHEGQTVTLTAEFLARDGQAQSGPQVAIRVIDQGTGISEEHAGKLFNPFFSGKASGVGLGLSIAKRIAQIHHGDIVFQSKEGEGSTFTLLLPPATNEPDATRASCPPPDSLTHSR